MAFRVLKPLERQRIPLRTRDGLQLSAWLWAAHQPQGRLTIVSPGFAQHHGTNIMRHIAQEFVQDRDVLGVDFRGMAGNPGRYGFGWKEEQDLQAAIQWAKARRYRDIEVIGFSMGAYIGLKALALEPGPVKRYFFVSGPTCVEDIARTLGPLRQAWALLTHWQQIKYRVWAGSQWFFRWDWPFRSKPRATEFAPRMRVPVAFLIGGQDQLVLPKLTLAVHQAVKARKTLALFPEGQHAEYMAVVERRKFLAWVQAQRKVLSARKGRR